MQTPKKKLSICRLSNVLCALYSRLIGFNGYLTSLHTGTTFTQCLGNKEEKKKKMIKNGKEYM